MYSVIPGDSGYSKNGAVQHTVTTGYGTDGRISSAGFTHGGASKNFGYEYLSGSSLLHKLTMPCNMSLTQTYESTRDLLTGMAYHRGSTLVAQRTYTYDILGYPTARNTARNGQTVNDTFAHNSRSELAEATVSSKDYEYTYDNIGNRTAAVETSSGVASSTEYTANELNQYTFISENGAAAFVPQFDADGNQTLIKTSTGIWSAVYNAENRPASFTNSESNIVVECAYDFMGRRAYKKVTVNGTVTLHQRYIYRGYLQIACLDLTRSHHPALWYITWDPSQPVATRPLAIQINGTWYTYGWDLTKNICELYSTGGTIAIAYTYSPFGKVTATGSLTQPIQWSSEVWDSELGLVYYNWRYYNAKAGRWGARDKDDGLNLYMYVNNNNYLIDVVGLSDIQRYVLFNRYKENEEYMFINNDIATFTHVPEKNYKYPTEYYWIGAENMLKDEIDKRNAASKDLQGRQCYQIDIYEKALTLHGLYSLPWEGYDKAILITHSMYINEIVSYYDTGIYLPDSRQSIKVQIGAPNVEVFGCHLSHEVGGKLEYRRDVLPLLFQYLDQLKYRDCCERIIYIQIVSNFRNHNDKIRVSNI